ncbi:TRAP transporter substrate-binding protein [Microbacterium sp.]|uniref:TRAP transporter substrate-binding protein n=1 Tax=Microbacterium sp. TaxID=51671 RepID=UPI003C70DDF4
MHTHRLLASAAAAVIVIVGLPACAAVTANPITLTIGTQDNDDTHVAGEIKHFADLVDTASGGSITITPVWRAAGDVSRWDQVVAQQVIDGELDLGMVPTRAWDALGVTSLRALNAPFVVTSDAALVGATADEIQDPMLEGLESAGIVGLDIFPESLRHPSGFAEPALGLDSYQDAVVRAPYSATTEAMLASFGATLDDGTPDPQVHNIQETSYLRAAGPTVTANVTFFGKFDVLVVGSDIWNGLNDEQRRVLRQASDETQKWARDHLPTDQEHAQEYCERGGRLALAQQDDVDALIAASAPVLDELAEDDVTATSITALRALAPAGPLPPVSCADTSETAVDITGTWEFTTTQEDLIAGGVTDPTQVQQEAATFRYRFTENAWAYDAVAEYDLAQPRRTGTLKVVGSRVTIFWSGQASDSTSMDAEILPDGTLQFTNIVDADPVYQKASEVKFGLRPWSPVEG